MAGENVMAGKSTGKTKNPRSRPEVQGTQLCEQRALGDNYYNYKRVGVGRQHPFTLTDTPASRQPLSSTFRCRTDPWLQK
jgi:hypothetical protein